MRCRHCQQYEANLPWREPDGLSLPHCICGYVGYDFTRPIDQESDKPLKPLKQRIYGQVRCIICGELFMRHSPIHKTCGPRCAEIRSQIVHQRGGA